MALPKGCFTTAQVNRFFLLFQFLLKTCFGRWIYQQACLKIFQTMWDRNKHLILSKGILQHKSYLLFETLVLTTLISTDSYTFYLLFQCHNILKLKHMNHLITISENPLLRESLKHQYNFSTASEKYSNHHFIKNTNCNSYLWNTSNILIVKYIYFLKKDCKEITKNNWEYHLHHIF